MITFAIALVLCAGCVSVAEKAGRILDGSAFREKRIARYRAEKKKGSAVNIEITIVQNKTGGQSVIIILNEFPMMKIRSSMPDDNGKMYLTSLEYLAGSEHGWNEYTLDLSGEGTLLLGDKAVFSIEDIEPVQISAGRIRRFNTFIIGADALSALRNRRERIFSIVEWMTSTEDAPYGQTIKNFEKYWNPLLFPEIVCKKKRPADWFQESDRFAFVEDIYWNTSYTERVFPEELKPIRDSGTLLRDWEEALSWIYMEYEWENIKKILSDQITLQKR